MSTRAALLWVAVSVLSLGAIPSRAGQSAATATFLGMDTSTQGNWKGVYGGDGNAIANEAPSSVPAYATFTPENEAAYTWTNSTTDIRALQMASSSARQPTCWYTAYSNSYDLNVNFTDGNTHQAALYALDWDNKGRSENVQVVDANSGAVLDTRLVTAFPNGIYYVWNISGHVKFNVTLAAGPNAVISAIFFEPTTSTPASVVSPSVSTPVKINPAATFLSSDTSTMGNWKGTYGADGYAIANDSQNKPSYATFGVLNQTNYTWVASPTDPRALQTGAGPGRIAATWYTGTTFDFDIFVTDTNSHQLALYLLDWDNQNRAEQVQIVDANTNAVLDTRSVSNFGGGVYLIWSIAGHVRVNVTLTGGVNAVASGVFFGGGVAPANASTNLSTTPLTLNNSSNVGSTNTSTNNPSTPGSLTASLPISVSVAPASVALGPGQNQTFAASVQNATTTSVNWSITPSVGSITSAGVYTAPTTVTTTTTVTVTATSAVSSSNFATATVTLTPPASGLPSGLVLHWTFDAANTSGTNETDTSNNGGTGTIAGNPTVVTGRINQAFTFNGVNSYVSMYAYGDKATEFNSSVTLAAWIATTNTSRTEAVISKFSAAGSGSGYIFRTDAAGHLELAVGAEDLSAYPGSVVDTAAINDGKWHHVVAVINMGQNVQFFVDGKLSSTSTMYTVANGDQWANLEVGSSSYVPYGNYFTGSIDDVQVYNRALSVAEVNSIFTLAGASQGNPTTQTQSPLTTQTLAATAPTTIAQGQLAFSSTSFNFGSVNVGSAAAQSFSITNVGTASVTISNVSVSGAGLNASGLSGTILAPTQSATLTVTFTPAGAGNDTGSVTITSNATNASVLISLTGTGVQAPVSHNVILNWAPSTSTDVTGYDVYRGIVSGGPYTLLTTSPLASTTFTDTTTQAGETYYYVVTSVSSTNVQSSYSSVVSVVVP